MEKKLFEDIYTKHNKQLKNLLARNKKLLICFSGIPGSGKTELAKILEIKYEAVRINSDDIRKIIHNLGEKHPKLLQEENREAVLKEYLLHLIENPPFPNKRIIFDSGIDRKYPLISKKAKERGFPLFIIRIFASKETAAKNIKQRLGKLDSNFINNIDRWVREFNEFPNIAKSDIEVKNEKNKIDKEKIFTALDKLIKYTYLSNHQKL